MAASSSSSSSSRMARPLHDVFLSFRGADTRNNFTSHLLDALNRQRFSTFQDTTKLRSGEDISSELLKAIEESRVSVVVFSKNYADSKWCLDELVKIMECRRYLNRIVLPIFYDVAPSQVRSQLGSYSEAFAKHVDRVQEGRLSLERVKRWRAALTEAANLSGYDLQQGDESKFIKEIVEDIVKRLDRLYIHVAYHLVGIESRVQEVEAMLNLGLSGVLIVGIWGVGGIGKTTIAKAIFNRIHDYNMFEGFSFLADVSDTAKESFGVLKLQKQLLSNVLMEDINNLDNYHQGIEQIKQKLCHRRVFLILDDVDHVEHLEMLAINRDFFGSGSRIIITTRNRSLLTSLQVNSDYSPKRLNGDESLELFSWKAFEKDNPEEDHRQLSNEIVAYAEGLPLVLEVFGSFLKGRSITEWKIELNKLKIIPNGKIQRKLEISFNSLDDINQELFLDIAFFFIGRDKYFTVKVLEDSGCFPESGIGELARRCLVRVDGHKLFMHNVLRDMGREIVRKRSKKLGERSRLWCTEEVLQILRDCTGTKAVEGLSLELLESNNEHVDTKAFANMSNLRLLHLNYLKRLSGTCITTSRNLKWVCWHGFPFKYIPAGLYMENLVAIELQYSKLKQMWKGPKRLDKLKFLNLSHSYHLIKSPDFSGLKSLEMLLLNDCTSLVKVHNSIGCLDKLIMLNITNCINLSKVPSSLFMLKSLEKLDFSGCSKLGELAEREVQFSMLWKWLKKGPEDIPISMASIQGLSCLRKLNLARCNIEYVPSGIGSLIKLKQVDLSRNNFCSLPSSFSHLSSLQDLYLDRCVRLKSLADLPNNLMVLKANNCISLETASVGMGRTMMLGFHNCPKLDGKSLSNNFKRNFLQVHQGRRPTCYYSLIFPGGELPNDIQFQGIGPKILSFVVPPFVGKKIIGLIACVVVSYKASSCGFRILNKTKGNTKPNHRVWATFPWKPELTMEDHVLISFAPLRKFILEAGDEADLTVWNYYHDGVVKRLGLSLIYEDDDRYLESNIE